MVIHLTKCTYSTISYGVLLTKGQQEQLAGDIQNWLMREKNVICNVRVD